ncbi:glycoside hydrolase family 140 protein [Fodinibius sediminis]|uniref:Collagen-binding domain of a collagenase n=1 Tax=Fodinibius sediminis TaxID=1214077 RepID=A0A521BYC4_9BACT|nr:glycoside hydrolase family 140 protein [Fodinibius sediminis]SMO52163.1 Putative collagen-binding domain of a collagenase [Fodinibius sediminis]
MPQQNRWDNKHLAVVFSIFFLLIQPFPPANAQQLRVSDNNRYLESGDGRPFFWLGDTAWELFHRLDREEANSYLENRAQKGFTVIQAAVLAELDGLGIPNPYGELPLENHNPGLPNDAYFDHVDYIVNKAEELGLYIGMLPTWGDKFNKKWGQGPEIFTPENAREYGRFLGQRYRNKPIIWILGGDRNPESSRHQEIITAMAEGLQEGDQGNHLITYHPQGDSNSAEWFHKTPWLDFNMFQSGHARADNKNYQMTLSNYHKVPQKPTLDGEPCYEDHPISWDPKNGWFHAFDARQAAYWSMLAGAMGHTYGNHNIWQMWEAGRKPISSARTPWQQAMDYPGAFQMGYMRSLFTSRPYTKLEPYQELVASDPLDSNAPARAAKARDNSFALIYIPHGQSITVQLSIFDDVTVDAWWYNPRMGESIHLKALEAGATHSFDPPADPRRGNDWILVLDRKSANLLPLQDHEATGQLK